MRLIFCATLRQATTAAVLYLQYKQYMCGICDLLCRTGTAAAISSDLPHEYTLLAQVISEGLKWPSLMVIKFFVKDDWCTDDTTSSLMSEALSVVTNTYDMLHKGPVACDCLSITSSSSTRYK